MNPAKFRFVFQTNHGNGRTSEAVLAETDSRDRATMLRHRIRSVAGGLTQVRACKKILVKSANKTRFALFNTSALPCPRKGQVFNSIDAFAEAMGANPVTLRAAISHARKDKKEAATVRGVTYAYAK